MRPKASTIIFETTVAGYTVMLLQNPDRTFSTRYGKEFKTNLSYAEAATELGVSQYGPAFILMWGLVALAWLMAGHIAGRSIRAVWRGRHR